MSQETTTRRRRVSISREGFSFLFVLSFIIIGALARQVNLLFVLAGLLIAALLINWRYGFALIRKVSVVREPARLIHAGQPLTVQFRVTNRHRWLPCWSLNVYDVIRKTFDPQHEFQKLHQNDNNTRRKLPRMRPERATVNIQEISPGQTVSTVCRFQLDQRGQYELGPVKVGTRFPLGLIWAFGKVKQQQVITVAPRVGRLTARWSALAFGNEGRGDERSRDHSPDASGDFYSIRAWRSGDSRRAIHWRSSAKTGELEVRQFEHQRNAGLAIILDLWQPTDANQQEIAATELAASIVATAVDHATKYHRGEICLVVAGEKQQSFHGRVSSELRTRILVQLATVLPGTMIDVSDAIKEAVKLMPQHFRAVVVSTRAQQTDDSSTVPAIKLPPRTSFRWVDVSSDQVDRLYCPD